MRVKTIKATVAFPLSTAFDLFKEKIDKREVESAKRFGHRDRRRALLLHGLCFEPYIKCLRSKQLNSFFFSKKTHSFFCAKTKLKGMM